MTWSPLQRILFRFFFCYLFFYAMSNQFILSEYFEMMWQKVVPWFAENFLHLEKKITIFTNGSGDTTYNYVSILVYVIVSILITVIWSIVDRHRPNYQKMQQWLYALVCYYIIMQMIGYGLSKLFYMQFQPPRFARLTQAYGDSSPMGLLWTFMGYSKGYTMFAGLGEFVGGMLLLFRRTRTLGALVVFGVMTNVMAMNFFYDVPVKLLSSHLVLICLFLLAFDAKRLWNFFVANKAIAPVHLAPYFAKPKWERIRIIAKWILVVAGLSYYLYETNSMLYKWGSKAPVPPLKGLYETEVFVFNGDTLPPLTTDNIRWKNLSIDWAERAQVITMNELKSYFKFIPVTTFHLIEMSTYQDTLNIDTLYYSWPDSVHLKLEGIRKNDTLDILMKSKKKEDFLLMNRGFRWINEHPYNR